MARDWTNEDMPTAPDSRDSVERRFVDEAMDRLAEAVAQPVGGSIVISTADACAIGNELRRLSATPKGDIAEKSPAGDTQQAGGEDGDGVANCAECGAFLEHVRPGKHQHPECSHVTAALQAEVARLNEQAEHLRRMYRNACRELALANEATLQARAALREAGRDAEDAKRWRSFRKTRSIRAEGLTPEHWDAREDAHIAAAETDAYDAALNGGQDDG